MRTILWILIGLALSACVETKEIHQESSVKNEKSKNEKFEKEASKEVKIVSQTKAYCAVFEEDGYYFKVKNIIPSEANLTKEKELFVKKYPLKTDVADVNISEYYPGVTKFTITDMKTGETRETKLDLTGFPKNYDANYHNIVKLSDGIRKIYSYSLRDDRLTKERHTDKEGRLVYYKSYNDDFECKINYIDRKRNSKYTKILADRRCTKHRGDAVAYKYDPKLNYYSRYTINYFYGASSYKFIKYLEGNKRRVSLSGKRGPKGKYTESWKPRSESCNPYIVYKPKGYEKPHIEGLFYDWRPYIRQSPIW